MVEGTGFENRQRGNLFEGSNPSASAMNKLFFGFGLIIGVLGFNFPTVMAIICQTIAGYLLYEFGLPPKYYKSPPGLIIGNLDDEAELKNKFVRNFSQVGIVLFLFGQILLIVQIN